MDLAKFYSLLHTSHLYFSRLDQMQDQFEGVTPMSTREQVYKGFESILRDNPTMMKKVDLLPYMMGKPLADRTRHSTYINCWHANDAESGAMWKIYGDESIAIQSTFQRFVESLNEERDREVNIGLVDYIDPDTWNAGTSYIPAILQKRPVYDYERELRAIVYDLSTRGEAEDNPTGIRIKISLPMLIEHVYVGPDKGEWYVDIVRDILDAHGLDAVVVVRSSMNGSPIFG